MKALNEKITNWLKGTNAAAFSIYGIIAAFGTYFCMYAFRKPYTATGFDVEPLWGINYKIILVTSQIIGYTLSKYAGIKFISEMKGLSRASSILILILFAELMLLFFGIVPYPYNFVFMFLNGLPLGMIWGIVFSFLEGRRLTELLGAGLSVSFVVSSGYVKSAGKALIHHGVPEFWMPFLTGLFFIPPLFFFVWMLARIPPPTAQDEEARTKRAPMTSTERWAFLKTFAPGMILLVLIYMFLTAFRDFRDNFMADILNELGEKESDVFASIETRVAFVLLGIIGATMLIKNNLRAFVFNHILIIAGFLLIALGTWLFEAKRIEPDTWMIMVGIGGYMGYIPFNCILFDRLIATFKYVGNAGFLIYVADAFGYTAAVGVMLFRNFGQANLSWSKFFVNSSWIMVVIGTILTIASLLYFANKKRNWQVSPSTSP